MKAMVCELCGSNEIVKDGEYFVCQSCGTKYTTEAARKLLIEFDKPVKVTGSVIAENVATISTLFERAKFFFEKDDLDKAKEYTNKVLDLDPQNVNAHREMALISEYEAIKRRPVVSKLGIGYLIFGIILLFGSLGALVTFNSPLLMILTSVIPISIIGAYFSSKSQYEEYIFLVSLDQKRMIEIKQESKNLTINNQ